MLTKDLEIALVAWFNTFAFEKISSLIDLNNGLFLTEIMAKMYFLDKMILPYYLFIIVTQNFLKLKM